MRVPGIRREYTYEEYVKRGIQEDVFASTMKFCPRFLKEDSNIVAFQKLFEIDFIDKEVLAFLKKGNENLGILGYTDHSEAHCALVAERAASVLRKLGYGEKEIELVKIAGFMHDIGNAVNRTHHAEYGAILANDLLKETNLSLEDRVTVVSAIGNHDESTGGATDVVSAALIIADKTDVRRNRVRNKDISTFDIHDRVNYAVTEAKLKINTEKKMITLNLQI